MSSLTRILQEYRGNFVQPSVVQRIRQREVNDDFPFSVHNMMRAFVNMSKAFFDGFWMRYKGSQTGQLESLHHLLGTPTRMYRYTLFLLIGAWLNTRLTWADKIAFLSWIADVLLYKIDNEVCLPQPQARCRYYRAIQIAKDAEIESIEISQLAVYLKEYIDFLFLGEHPVGYLTYPPYHVSNHAMIVRRFFNITYGDVIQDLETAEIVDVYDISATRQMSFDLFRGNLDNIPSYRERIAGSVIIDDVPVTNSEGIRSVITLLSSALQERTRYYARCSKKTLEVEQALIYSSELQLLFEGSLPSSIESEIRDSVYTDRVAGSLKHQFSYATYTDLYFTLLEKSLGAIENHV